MITVLFSFTGFLGSLDTFSSSTISKDLNRVDYSIYLIFFVRKFNFYSYYTI
jgi:hypothetical protein